jgi:hypothetical protein
MAGRIGGSFLTIGALQCKKLTESAEAGPITQAPRSPTMIAATLCGRSDQTDYLRGEPGKARPG